ncbi:universal stress protein [Streptomyces sp. CLV115]|uniref:universal stress protein n=1 Tax=Streptomyces sp. CLV115 TaxID=3138502 RepID=UPI00313B524C
MQLPTVVGADGPEGSLRALDRAAAEASRSRLPLRVVHASLWEHCEGMRPAFGTGRPAEQILAEHLVASAQERVHRRHPAYLGRPRRHGGHPAARGGPGPSGQGRPAGPGRPRPYRPRADPVPPLPGCRRPDARYRPRASPDRTHLRPRGVTKGTG